ncbi:unnamed protein product [Ambrosiozyma monospora]|uniref:Unnamed protein product n=1 Tax=Ambrosiozyma monospora TaxID=43982 RepID=A0ACB5TEW4_AMBMO|nr:unnamed protein product [Ambrosiozyma monospora]
MQSSSTQHQQMNQQQQQVSSQGQNGQQSQQNQHQQQQPQSQQQQPQASQASQSQNSQSTQGSQGQQSQQSQIQQPMSVPNQFYFQAAQIPGQYGANYLPPPTMNLQQGGYYVPYNIYVAPTVGQQPQQLSNQRFAAGSSSRSKL